MLTIHWLKNKMLQKGNESLLTEWLANKEGFIWIDVNGETPNNEHKLLINLGCHPLAIADAQKERHPPAFEKFSEHIFILYRGIHALGEDLAHNMQAVSMFIGKQFLITVHQKNALDIEQIIKTEDLEKLLTSPVKLASAILNTCAILYTDSILQVEESLSELEELMGTAPSDEVLNNVLFYRRTLRKFRRTCAYHEKVMANFLKEQHSSNADESILHSVQDPYDKFERLLSLSSLYYDLCGDLSDGYLSLTSHQLNKTMQVLTVITAIFVPLTFLAGIYGMNFEYMPELRVKHAYPMLILVMLLVATSLIILFKKKRWL
jgi:magnesium transporter